MSMLYISFQNGMTPLLIACYIDHADLVQELLKADACVNAVNNVRHKLKLLQVSLIKRLNTKMIK